MSKLVECPACNNPISVNATSCPKCGEPLSEGQGEEKVKEDQKNGAIGCVVLIILAIFGGWYFFTDSEEEKLAKEIAQKAEIEAAAIKKEADTKAGFHCLSSWDGSHIYVKNTVEKQMRDPDSFEHIETRITPVSKEGTHILSMKYRARNGFGGMTPGEASAIVTNADCSAVVLSVE